MRRIRIRPVPDARSPILTGAVAVTAITAFLGFVLGFPAADAAPNPPNESLFLAGGWIVDPLVGAARPAHVMIVDGVVAGLPKRLPPSFAGHLVDASGRFIAPRFLDLRLRASNDVSSQSPFETLVAGPILTVEGGHGSERGDAFRRLDSPADARRQVAELIDAEVPLVHVAYASAGGGSRSAQRSIDRPTLDAAIEAASRSGRPVLVHVDSWDAVREAIQAGADGFVHLPAEPLPDDLAPWLAQREAVCVPTLTTGETTTSADLDEVSAQANRRDAVRRLDRAGVQLLAGTEHPGDPSWLHDELEAMVDAGISMASALRTVTFGARRFLDRPWSFARGTPSHFLIFEKSPLDDIRHTRTFTATVRDGSWIERTDGQPLPTTARPDPPQS